jgi:hypothetical protein
MPLPLLLLGVPFVYAASDVKLRLECLLTLIFHALKKGLPTQVGEPYQTTPMHVALSWL